jgi:PHD/YefM family antitoxin component YafN of YafNO toxin-antitoxin module
MKHKTTPQFTATASPAEVARNFGRYKDLAQRGAAAVTSHGRESVVMLSADEYARLKALDDREALYIHELSYPMTWRRLLKRRDRQRQPRLSILNCPSLDRLWKYPIQNLAFSFATPIFGAANTCAG